ncbi:hypothetical protein V8D89_002475 [Ganoderma adspersum]
MSFDNSTHSEVPTVEVSKLALDILQDAAVDAASTVVQILLSSLLFGAFTVLAFTSIYFLVSEGPFSSQGSTAQTNGKILLLSIALLYIYTAAYMAVLVWSWSDRSRLISKAVDGLSAASYDGQYAIAAFEHALHTQSSLITLALGGNIVIGDAIVWWRACVIWQHRLVNCIGLLLLTLTTSPQTISLTFLFQELYGQISGFLSLCTNILATSLIAYKALPTGYVAHEKSQIFAVLYQNGQTSLSGTGLVFRIVATDFAYGCFVPIVAIYPTIIIVLVALKRSPIDTAGLSHARQAYDSHRLGAAEGGMSSTIVFHHSTFNTSASEGTEGAGGIQRGDLGSGHSLQVSMNLKDVRPLASLIHESTPQYM